jgi:hypothetical protein
VVCPIVASVTPAVNKPIAALLVRVIGSYTLSVVFVQLHDDGRQYR